MAVKGKKKARNRGSGGRAPAAAPRPAIGQRKPPPWYQTTRGRIIAGAVAAVVMAVTATIVVNARSSSAATAAAADRIDGYTDELRGVAQKVSPPATAMAGLAPETSKATLGEIEDGTKAWQSSLVQAAAEATSVTPPQEISGAHALFVESIQLYSSAAATFELALDLDGPTQTAILATAATDRGHAERVWAAGVSVVDGELADLGAGPSGLTPPSTPAQAPGLTSGGAGTGNGGGGNGGG